MLQRVVISKWDPTTPQTEPVITLLDRHALNREFNAEFGGPASFTGQVWSNDPEVNILYDDNFTAPGNSEPFRADYPFLAEGVRILRWFRRENTTQRWIIRHGGFVHFTQDAGDENTGRTQFTSWDPWQLLMRRPCYRVKCIDQDCATFTDYATAEQALLGPPGLMFRTGENIEDIVRELLRRTIVLDGPTGIDAGTAWGGTAFYNGTVEACGTLAKNLVFQQGTMVGQAWQQLFDTAQCEIVLRPIYDPANRPGYVAELDIFAAGDAGDLNCCPGGIGEPMFSWDRNGHDLTRLVRTIDGRERANKVKFYIGGPSAGKVPTATQTSAPSVTRFGQTWNLETRERTINGDSVVNQADRDLEEREVGLQTWELSPTPEFTWRPFQDYDLGTYIGLFNSNRLREEMRPIDLRVRGFTVNMSNEGVETVSRLEVWREF
jgi:hypothetical protein